MMNDTQRQKRIETAQTKLLLQVPFFAPGVLRLPVRFEDNGRTACTDGKQIRWDRTFFDSLKDQEVVTILAHEAGHCLFGHLWRLPPPGGDWQRANIACDHVLNLMLKEFGEVQTRKGFADPFPFPGQPGDYCCDPQYKGMAEEEVYNRLPQNPPPQGSGQGNKIGSRGNSGANSGGGKPSIGEFEAPAEKNGQNGQGQSSGNGLQSDWEGTLLQSATIAKGRGELPASLDRFVQQLVSPQLPWTELLRSWLREQASDDWNWLQPAMEYEGSGFILPSLKSERLGPVVFATDTSGSIDNELLAKFQSEKQNCLDELRPRKVVDIYCDAKIQKVEEYSPGDRIKCEAPGGGGTRFEPVWEYCEAMNPAPKCLVYLTDLQGSFGQAPPFPVIWIAYGPKTEAPFGEVVYVEK